MQIQNIAGYKFVPLDDLDRVRQNLLAQCGALKGTILLSKEGINLSLAGTIADIAEFKAFLQNDSTFADMSFRESYSESIPFKRMKIKLKKEIITMRQPDVKPIMSRAASIDPETFKQWLDEGRDITILDTRNDYEMEFGTFKNAVNLHLEHFVQFPEAAKSVTKEKPIVMFCTGGIRCEKAAIHMQNLGYANVYQLDGGILNYFAQVGGEHYEGQCYVFDERVAVDADLKPIVSSN